MEPPEEVLEENNSKIAEENRFSPQDKTVTDATSTPKMATANVGQGKKRSLSLSPQVLKGTNETDTNNLESLISPNRIQAVKKRVLAAHTSDFLIENKVTGNDPERGHAKTGNESIEELDRTESNMAPPMLSNMADQNKTTDTRQSETNLLTDHVHQEGNNISKNPVPEPTPVPNNSSLGTNMDSDIRKLRNRSSVPRNSNNFKTCCSTCHKPNLIPPLLNQ